MTKGTMDHLTPAQVAAIEMALVALINNHFWASGQHELLSASVSLSQAFGLSGRYSQHEKDAVTLLDSLRAGRKDTPARA